ncbi:hypothetical protein UAY_02680 [Enterococcus moraviensis ATCC BAA-383]|uniref:Bacterial Pleckstrin homology domain-containing protein n=1 Tax=Enterococcus moraviensis ATCC BAA-383 TaxID=1158609 RepID=R2QP27_9ENTE|nr:PH domain-containing protein [Enterococcus moraviensis]EOH96948.1 hypothetical protein UAY_02680 [Enterococcus moraviensis ATCC BAA-383]EOT71437.1 hypothetical protein I586_01238 [Enterococcus moraviensis ATCC BAA-383]
MNFFLYLLLVGVNFVMAFSGRIPANPHKNIILETTLPKEKLQDEQVLTVSRTYKKRLLQWAFVFSVIALPIIVIPYDSLTLIYFIMMTIGIIGTSFYLQVIYIRKMTTIKVQNDWILPTSPILVDTTLVANKNRKLISAWWFLPSILITVLGFIYSFKTIGLSNGTWIMGILSLLMSGMFLLFYYFIARFPVKPVTSDATINQQVNDQMRHHWSVLMAVSSLVLSPLSFLPTSSVMIPYEQMMLFSVGYAVFILLFVLFTFYYLFSSRKKQDQLIAQAKEYRYSDEDQYWKYGLYINPDDKRIMVPDRVGMNISANLGRPAGKLTLGLTGIVVLIALVVACVPLLISDFSANPFELETTHNGIYLSAPLSQSRKIDWNEIETVKLVDTLPKNRLRVYGTATENYLTGEFQVNNKPAYLLVLSNKKPILEIQTKNKWYYYTNKDSKLTEKYYNNIQSMRGK